MEEFDTSKLEKTGWRLFQSQMIEWYTHEFKELPLEYKKNAIEYVIQNHVDIFTREVVLAENLCHMCGLCCIEIGCPDYDKESRKCTKHNNQNSIICYEYPWSDVGMTLSYNCGYQRDLFIRFLDSYFTKAIELMREKNGKKEEE